MDDKLKSLIGQYCQYPSAGIWTAIFEYVHDWPYPTEDMGGYIKAYETMIEYIRRFDRAYQLCGRGFDGEKADALEDTVSECYFGYWEATRY